MPILPNFFFVFCISIYQLKSKCVYIRMSPRYSLAPSPLPPMALADAHFTELLAPIPLMIAPACSAGSFPALYRQSLTQTELNPLSLQIHASSTSSNALLSFARILAIVSTCAPSGMFKSEMTATLSSISSTPVTEIILAPASIAFCASSLFETPTIASMLSARAHLMKNSAFSPTTPYERRTACAPAAALLAICTSSTMISLHMTGTGSGISPFADSCSSAILVISQ
mmetsp:Transcript_22668/g.33548  ORF Transcript_22668/g.33548 Transcript_22668/m.33548 type:complete len:228 (-) Transcript_22668:530-1213(-)